MKHKHVYVGDVVCQSKCIKVKLAKNLVSMSTWSMYGIMYPSMWYYGKFHVFPLLSGKAGDCLEDKATTTPTIATGIRPMCWSSYTLGHAQCQDRTTQRTIRHCQMQSSKFKRMKNMCIPYIVDVHEFMVAFGESHSNNWFHSICFVSKSFSSALLCAVVNELVGFDAWFNNESS